jgi:hypothetical protein
MLQLFFQFKGIISLHFNRFIIIIFFLLNDGIEKSNYTFKITDLTFFVKSLFLPLKHRLSLH